MTEKVIFDGILMPRDFVPAWAKMLAEAERLKREGRGIYSSGNTNVADSISVIE